MKGIHRPLLAIRRANRVPARRGSARRPSRGGTDPAAPRALAAVRGRGTGFLQQLNPDDFLAWFSEADARLKTGNFREAPELLTLALVLPPRRPSVLETLQAVAERAGVTVDDAPIAPTAWFQDEKNLYLNRPYPWWVSYAVCKHLGCTEPDLDRCDIKGRQPLPPAPWDAKAETACVRVAAAAYRNKRDPGYSEAALERFLAGDAAGLGEAYVLYEIGSRLDPHIVLLRLPPEKRKDVDRYVRSFVIVDRR